MLQFLKYNNNIVKLILCEGKLIVFPKESVSLGCSDIINFACTQTNIK